MVLCLCKEPKTPDGRELRKYHGILATLCEVVYRSGPGVLESLRVPRAITQCVMHCIGCSLLMFCQTRGGGKSGTACPLLRIGHAFSTDILVTDLCAEEEGPKRDLGDPHSACPLLAELTAPEPPPQLPLPGGCNTMWVGF